MTNDELDEYIGNTVRIAIGADNSAGASVAYLYGILQLLGEIAKRLPEQK